MPGPSPATIPAGPIGIGAAAAPAPVPPLRVLLVEDQALVAMVLADTLLAVGHDVVAAQDAEAALAAWAEAEAAGQPFDALVTDLGLTAAAGPPLAGTAETEAGGGLALIRRLRGMRRGLPVVVVTGHEMTEEELRARLGRRPAGRRGETTLLGKAVALDALPAALGRAAAAARPRGESEASRRRHAGSA